MNKLFWRFDIGRKMMPVRRLMVILFGSMLLFLGVSPVRAANIWDGGGANDLWNTANNWDDNAVPSAGAALHFAGTTRLTASNNLTAGTSFASIYFDSGAGSFILSRNQITLTSLIENNSANIQTINLPINLGSGTTLGLRTIAGSGNMVISGVISGAGNVEKQVQALNATDAILSGENTYSGTTRVLAGNLSISSIKPMGSASASSVGKPSSGNGNIGMGAAATLIYTGTGDTTDRAIDLQGNNVELRQSGSGHLKFTSNVIVSVSGTKTFNLNGSSSGTGEISGNIPNPPTTGNTRIFKIGSGTWTLSGTNSYLGTTIINGGTLIVGANAPSASDGALGNATTAVRMGETTGSDDVALIIQGPFTVGRDISIKTNSTGVSLLGGNSAHTATFSGIIDLERDVLFSAANGGSVTFSGAITNTGGITKSGLGSVMFSANNTYSGATAVENGTLIIDADAPSGGDGALGNATTAVMLGSGSGSDSASLLIGGAYTVGRSVTVRSGTSGTLTLGGNSAHASGFSGNINLQQDVVLTAVNGATVAFSGAITNAGGITKTGAGTVVISGANTYAGATDIDAGTLSLGASGSLNPASAVSIAAGATLDVSDQSSPYNWGSSSSLNAAGTGTSVGSTAAAIKGPAGGTVSLGTRPITLTYDGANPALYISQGTLSLSGNAFVINSASPLADGVYTIAQQSSGTINISGTHTVSGTAIPSGYIGAISASGGNLQLSLIKIITATVTLDSKVYDGTTDATTIASRSLNGVEGGDDVSLGSSGTAAVFSSRNVGSYNVLVSGLSLSGVDAGEYVLHSTVVTSTASITARPVTVTAATDSKTYDGTTSSVGTPTLTSGSVASGDSEPAWTQTFSTKHAGTGKTLTPAGTMNDGNGGSNYSVTYADNTTGVITARPLTITAAPNSKGYDGNTSASTAPTITSGSVQAGDTANFIQTYDNADIGTGKTLTPSGTVTDGNSGNNYSYTFVSDDVGTITGGAVTELVIISAPVTAAVNVASSTITVQRQDAGGNPNSTEGSRTVTLSSDTSGTATFTPSSVTITGGSSIATFTYTDSAAGWPTITAASTSPDTITSANQQQTIVGTSANNTWDGGGGNNNWGTQNNWDNNTAPAPGNKLRFDGSTRLTPVNDLPAGATFADITFNSGAGSFTLSGNQITMSPALVGTDGIRNQSANPQTVDLPIRVNAGNALWVYPLVDSGDLTISGEISGEGGFIKTQLAEDTVLFLTGSNTYSGTTTIYSGNLSINSIKEVGSASPSSLGKPSEGNGVIYMGGAEALQPNLIYTGTGDTTDRGIDLYAASVFLTQNGTGLLKFTGPFTASQDITHGLNLNGTGTGEIASTIVDAASNFTRIIKHGDGTWILSGTNTYGGTTTIDGGTLIVSSTGRLLPGYSRNMPIAGTFIYAGTADQILGGDISGTGTVVMAGPGVLTLSGASTSTGRLIVSNGTVLVTGSYTGTLDVPNGGRLIGTGNAGNVHLRGGTLNPGLSPGTLNVSSLALTSGTYVVEVTNATGTAGINWDLINVNSGSGIVSNHATSGDPIIIDLLCSQSSLPGFYGTNAISWTIIDAGQHNNFASNKFVINTSNFTPIEKYDGVFTVSSNSGDLVVNFTPYSNPVDLGVSAEVIPNYLVYGATNSFVLVVSNNSAFVSGSYYVSNTLSTSLTYNVAYSLTNSLTMVVTHHTADGGVFSGGVYVNGTYSGGNVTWTLWNLGAGASTTLILNASQSVFSESTQEVFNVSSTTLTTTMTDPTLANNTTSSNFTTVGVPMLTTLGLLALANAIFYAFYRHQRRSVEA